MFTLAQLVILSLFPINGIGIIMMHLMFKAAAKGEIKKAKIYGRIGLVSFSSTIPVLFFLGYLINS